MTTSSKTKIWKSFWTSLFKIFLLVVPTLIFTSCFFGVIALLFSQPQIDNYAELIAPEYWKPFNSNWTLNKTNFFWLGISAVVLYFSFAYLYEFFSRKLIIRISSYLKNKTLRKFRNLPLEEQLKRKGETRSLVELDGEIVAYHWVNFWRNLFEGSFGFLLFFYAFFYRRNKGEEKLISNKALIFSFFWIVFIVAIIYLFYKLGYHLNKETKAAITAERQEINYQIDHMTLLNGMGLDNKYEQKQQDLTKKTNQFKVANKRRFGLEMTIPWKLLINLFPLGLLLLEPNRVGAGFETVWGVLNNCVWSFGYLRHWSDYASSKERIDNFLNLPERNDNLGGLKLENDWTITKIRIEKVSFKYRDQEKPMTFNNTFTNNKINCLTTPNGSGKTTQLYLLLGLLEPQQGNLIIEQLYVGSSKVNRVSYKKKIKLKQVNLKYWRSKIVAFCSYQTLVQEGSAGQKQLENIKRILKRKKEVQVFIFDEVDNALDAKNKSWFQTQLEQLVRQGKLVICVRQKEQ